MKFFSDLDMQGNSILNAKVSGFATTNDVNTAQNTAINSSKLTLEKSADGLTYTLKQGGSALSPTINIPKDMVVNKGSIVTGTWNGNTFTPSDSGTGKALKLELTNSTDVVYINVADLVDVYTGSTGSRVNVSISSTNQISADLVSGSITETYLDSKVVAKLLTDAQKTTITNAITGVKRNGTTLTPTSGVVDITVPTKTSDLTHDSGFALDSAVVKGIKINGSAKTKDSSGVVDLGSYVVQESGKGLSTNDFTNAYKTKLNEINYFSVKITTSVNQYAIDASTHGCGTTPIVELFDSEMKLCFADVIVDATTGKVTINSGSSSTANLQNITVRIRR